MISFCEGPGRSCTCGATGCPSACIRVGRFEESYFNYTSYYSNNKIIQKKKPFLYFIHVLPERIDKLIPCKFITFLPVMLYRRLGLSAKTVHSRKIRRIKKASKS